MSDVKINIETTASGDGAEKTVQGLGKVTDAARTETPAHKEAAAATEKHAHSHRELHVAAHSLAGHLPHLTALLWAFRSPLVAGGLAIGVFIEWCQHLRDKWKELEDSSTDLASKLTLFEGSLKGPRDRIRENRDAARELKAALDEVTEAARDPGKKLSEEEAAIEKNLAREKEINSLRKEKQFALVEGRVANREIDEFQGKDLKANIAEHFLREDFRLEDEARQAKLKLQAGAHMQAQQDFLAATDANKQIAAGLGDAKANLRGFDRGEKFQAEARALRDADLAKRERELTSKVGDAQGIYQREVEEEMRLGGGQISDLGRRRLGMSINKQTLDKYEAELAATRGERKSIFDAGEAQARKREGLVSIVTEHEADLKDTVAAAAKAKAFGESTRSAAVDLGREGTAAATQFEATSSLRSETARIQGENAVVEAVNRAFDKIQRAFEAQDDRMDKLFQRQLTQIGR